MRVVLHTQPSSPRYWMFELGYPPLDRMDLYLSSPSGQFVHQSGGDSLPFASRLSAPITLWQPSALWQQDQKTYSVFSLYFGLLIGLLLYNLLLFMSIRDPAYLIYVAFVAFIGLSQAANSGLGVQFLWPEALCWNSNSITEGWHLWHLVRAQLSGQ
jgi:hypothetical protein